MPSAKQKEQRGSGQTTDFGGQPFKIGVGDAQFGQMRGGGPQVITVRTAPADGTATMDLDDAWLFSRQVRTAVTASGTAELPEAALLGSTGSIGTQALQVARHLAGEVEVVALAGGTNAALLSQQLHEFRPRLYHSLAADVSAPSSCRRASLDEIASDERVDTVLVATSGRAGLEPTLCAIEFTDATP